MSNIFVINVNNEKKWTQNGALGNATGDIPN